jgi:NAD(P)-dependent dehydrogenase (short-subunit alcohol dehydrogenase family)
VTRVAVVTGAGGAMGHACAAALAADVDVLLATDIDTNTLASAAKRIRQIASSKVSTVAGDIADRAFVDDLSTRVAALGDLHSLVHTAGLSPSMAGWRDILRVDLVATAALLEAFTPRVVRNSTAVCIASVSGHMGAFDPAIDAVLDDPLANDFEARFRSLHDAEPDPGATYRLAKHGVVRLCQRAAVAWGARGGRVVSLSPGLIDTDMGRLELEHNSIKTWMAEITPLAGNRAGGETVLPGRIADIADTVSFLCSERASFISGCDVLVDGGLLAAMNNQT